MKIFFVVLIFALITIVFYFFIQYKNPFKNYYVGLKENLSLKPKREGSFPLISGDTLRLLSDYIFDEIENNIQSDFNLKDNAKIFVKTDNIELFYRNYLLKFKKPIVLITHNSDYSITKTHENILEDERIIVWFAQNVEFSHPKLIPIPIGFQNTHHSQEYTKKLLDIEKERNLKPWNERKILMYLNFNSNTNIQVRQKLLSIFANFTGVYIAKNRVDFSTYMSYLNDSKFVLCPRGNGLDTHRFYETILSGSIPIVQSSHLDSIYEKSTVLILPNLDNLTQNMLEEPHKYIKEMNFPKNTVYVENWLNKINSFIVK